MKKIAVYTLAFAVIGALSSCGDAALERKMENLERRVAQLENNGGSTTAAPQPIANQAPAVPDGPLPTFNFEETSFDFGTIQEGTKAVHVFKFTNEGEAPLIISEAQGSCGCTVPSYPKEPIPVGATGEIRVEFNSQGRTGNQQKFVSLTANTNPSITRLSIKAQVDPAAGATTPAE
ncbi:MAG TPA: DUF1573 domain-containing protein [Cytophagales bacterium]|nr:DUF1573 domain-containing protein [Cytophagales bacterium]HAA21503.1 DUF1573 domain-containing protein [Cytophagales bacterium]HAP64636.1 DUF1573 domain-containing protein [Cytophagales bacterium]